MQITEGIERRWQMALDAFRADDKKGALYIFMSLAKDEFYPAYTEIANIYELGGGGVTQDFNKAIHWYRKAAYQAGDEVAHVALGRLYYFGKGVTKSYTKAFEHYEKALSSRSPVALLMFGRRYHRGLDVPVNYNKAKEYYSESADNGNVFAMVELGNLEVENGNIVRGIIMKLKGVVLGFLYYYLRDKNDVRLRSC